MKKILTILLLAFAFIATASAQSTTPRFGTTSKQDNTYRVLNLGYTAIAEVAGNDTISIAPAKYCNYYRASLTDSVTLKFSSVTGSYAGDILYFIISGSSGTKVKFITTNTLNAGTATLSTNGRSIITLLFDGAKWTEASRVTQ